MSTMLDHDASASPRLLVAADSQAYTAATQPHNSSVQQRPVRVAAASHPQDLAVALAEVAALERSLGRSLEVVPQATGHGAGAPVGNSAVLLDTSQLTDVVIDPEARIAVVGAGATWAAVNAAAERHGLLGLAGSAPTVSVSGYTFGGGIGWLVRRDGLASGALRAVHYVDGAGRSRTAADDATDPIDRDAIWAFRGAGGVGIAHTLEIDLVPAAHLHAGALLWHADALPDLVSAWSHALPTLATSASSSIGVLHVPPLPLFPQTLHGKVTVHLAIADPDGPDAAAPLLEAMRAVAPPVLDTWGPTDAAGLARIHLDPPTATPAVGDARWLDASTPDIAAALLATAADDDAGVVMMEIRHVAGAPTRRPGAVTTAPGDFIYHAVAPLNLIPRERIEAAFARARAVWSSADAGTTPGSWLEGAANVPDALTPGVRTRAAAAAAAVDPDTRIRRSRLLG
ncbi:FAD-binding oxidoreductase [Kineococcus radiotolerans]|uniref:FAD linked oxidase domain protein n=1 Tax=Kineococcus radiotolerans (strain ATCC BAA-149 / DSM 14245 / SRS30216) TaxID=266940 RepID=A6WA49_KINRD|nr:FAD-binding protein [Kineococcus radiotolerans]ABS03688.1 FAD linked oxidase domain protein [Kineococcus radiotolerans SRS30216 = ATCC BAA-149]